MGYIRVCAQKQRQNSLRLTDNVTRGQTAFEQNVKIAPWPMHVPCILLGRLCWRLLATTLYDMSWTTTVFVLFCCTTVGGRVKSFLPGGEPLNRTRGLIVQRSVYDRAPSR